MQTAKSTLKLKVPISVVTPLPKKQVVVIDKNTLQKKTANVTPTKNVKPNSQNNKAARMQLLAQEQQEALKATLTRWKAECKQILMQ